MGLAKIDAVPGSADDTALKALDNSFPGLAKHQPSSVVVYYSDGVTSVANSSAARAVAAAVSAVAPPYIANGLLTSDSGSGYFTWLDAGLPTQANFSYLSNSGAALLVSFTSTQGQALSANAQSFLKDLNTATTNAVAAHSGGGLKADITGFLQISVDSSTSILLDVAVTDCITVTLSFILLGCALRSFKLIGVAFLALVAAFGFAFMLTWPLTTTQNVPNFTTSLVISTLISMSLDYCLFLLSHLKASLARGVDFTTAIEAMLRSSGHVIIVSGATLASCFLVLGTEPLSIVRSPGIATTFAVIGCVLSNLTLTPSLLLISRRVFDTNPAQLAAQAAKQPRMQAFEKRLGAFTVAWWRGVARLTRNHKFKVTAAVLTILIVPFAPHLPYFLPLSTQTPNISSRGTTSIELNQYVSDNFGPGTVTPARLLGVANPSVGGALSPAFFAAASTAVNAVLSQSSGYLRPVDVYGLAWQNGAVANAAAVSAAVASTASCPNTNITACVAACSPQACSVRLQASSTLSPDSNSMWFLLDMQKRIDNDAGVTWTKRVRKALSSVNTGGVTWYLTMDPGASTAHVVGENFGQLVGITACVVFFIIGASFSSVPMAVRSVITLAAMEIAVFGSASAIYCRGLLGDGGVLHTFKGDYGLFWLMPILAFSLMTGLGLDYDVFIIESICHERDNGWEVGDAISVGVQRSGPIISWAGAIMSVAYGGYLFADIPLLNQLGMFIVYSVVLDTFIVRPLLVPAIMHILGPANFWPRRCPPVTKPPLVDECVPELEPQVNDVESRSSNDSHVEASSM